LRGGANPTTQHCQLHFPKSFPPPSPPGVDFGTHRKTGFHTPVIFLQNLLFFTHFGRHVRVTPTTPSFPCCLFQIFFPVWPHNPTRWPLRPFSPGFADIPYFPQRFMISKTSPPPPPPSREGGGLTYVTRTLAENYTRPLPLSREFFPPPPHTNLSGPPGRELALPVLWTSLFTFLYHSLPKACFFAAFINRLLPVPVFSQKPIFVFLTPLSFFWGNFDSLTSKCGNQPPKTPKPKTPAPASRVIACTADSSAPPFFLSISPKVFFGHTSVVGFQVRISLLSYQLPTGYGTIEIPLTGKPLGVFPQP